MIATVFEGAPDARQSDDVGMPVSRFQPRYRALTDAEKALHDAIKSRAAEFEALFEQVKPERYRSLAFTDLEASVMWCIKELTSWPQICRRSNQALRPTGSRGFLLPA